VILLEPKNDIDVEKLVTAYKELSDHLTKHRTVTIFRHLKKHDLTLNQYYILYFIDQHGPCSPIKLAELLDLKAATITYLVDSLEKRGLVTRTPNPQDGRSHFVNYTEAGQLMVIDTRQGPVQSIRESFEQMDQEEAETTYILMRLLLRKLLPG
jgi:MarR family transcriptional regulator, 2-MHQ and catechol-resistance regulon repressor